MAWPGTLNAEEQELVKVFVDQLFRPDVLRLVQALNISRGIKEEWDNRIQALFTKLAAGDVIPNGTGYAGAEAMSKSEITSMLTDVGLLLTTFNTAAKRAEWVKAIGSVNMIRE